MLSFEDALRLRDFPHRTPIHLSPDGTWIAYTVRSRDKVRSARGVWRSKTDVTMELLGSEAWVTETKSGRTHKITENWGGSSWSGPWSPDGTNLLFASDRGGVLRAWRWCALTGDAEPVCDDQIRSPWGYDPPIWSRDGKRVFLRLFRGTAEQAEGPAHDAPTSVWVHSSGLAGIADTQAHGSRHRSDDFLADVAVADLSSKDVLRLATGLRLQCLELSHDGGLLAAVSLVSGSYRQELHVVPVSGKPPYRLVGGIQQGFGTSVSWSPDDRDLAYLDAGELWTVAVATGETKRLTDQNEICVSHPYARPIWDSRGEFILCVSEGKLWQIRPTDESVTEVSSSLNRLVKSVLHRNGDHTLHVDEGILVQTLDEQSRREGIYSVYPDGSSECLLEHDVHIGNSLLTREPLASYEDISADGGTIAYVEQASNRSPDIWLASRDSAEATRVTQINESLASISLGKAKLVAYGGLNGEERTGALLMPPGVRSDDTPPVIFYVYPDQPLADGVNLFGLGTQTLGNPQLWATRGFAVFLPDMRGSGRFNVDGILPVLIPALDHLSQGDGIDTQCAGIVGHSEGGYLVNALITLTDRFRCAISAAGISDLSSLHLGLWPDGKGCAFCPEMEEILGGTPWESPEKYVQNSPLFHLHRSDTPLLLLHGMADDACPWQQAGEMFAGLRHLGRKAQLALYEDEGHGMHIDWEPEHAMDLWQRTVTWFETHLGSATPSPGTAQGCRHGEPGR